VNCKCACLCAVASYNLREPCFILSGGCRKCVKLSYNIYGVKNNFTNGRSNFTKAYCNFTRGSCKHTKGRSNFTKGYYIKKVADFIKLLTASKFQSANCFVLGTCRTEHRFNICILRF